MDQKEVFEYYFGCTPETLPETAIITPFISTKRFKEHCDLVTSFKGRLYSGMIASKNGHQFAVIYCGMGDCLMGDAVLLLKNTPVQKAIFAGSCGGLNGCRIGDIVICESAFNGEGFTRYHEQGFDIGKIFETGKFASSDSEYTELLRKFISKHISDKGILKTGDIFTIGSLMAEQDQNLIGIEEKGFKGIEMELSAVYRAAQKVDLKAAGLVFVSDLPIKKPLWQELTVQEKGAYDKAFDELVRLSIDFVVL